MFQSLVGKLETLFQEMLTVLGEPFQSLVGKLETRRAWRFIQRIKHGFNPL